MLRWIGSLVVVVVLALLGLAGWVLGTERGANWLAREAELFTGGAVRIAGVHGSFAEGLRIDEFAIVAGTTKVDGRELVLRVLPASLLRGRLAVATLRAQWIGIEVAPAAVPTGEPFRMPRLSAPWPVEIEDLGVSELVIRRGEAVWTVMGIGLAGSMRDTSLALRRLQARIAGFDMRAEGSAALEPELPVDARIEWRLADPALSGAGTVRGNLAAIDLEQVIQVPGAVTVSATVYDLASGPRVQGTATWDAVQLEMPGLGEVRTSAGRATLEGTIAAWRATLAADARAAGLPATRARATAHGADRRIAFDEIRLDGEFGAIVAQGEFDLEQPRRLALDITASNLDTSAFRRGLEGRLSAQARLDAQFPGEIRIRIADLNGRLMGRPLAGRGEVGYRDGLLSFGNVRLQAGPNSLRADGTLGDRLSGRFDIDAPDLAVLWPDLAGSLEAHATLAGTRAQPVIDLDATGHGLRLAGNTVTSLELHGRVDRRRQLRAELAVRGISSGNYALGDLDAGLQGGLDAHELTAHLSGGLFAADLVSAGSWNGRTLQHRVASARVVTDAFGPWQLAGEPDVALRADAVTVGDHCWEQAPASLCLSGLAWSPARTQLVADLRSFDLQYLGRWLPQDVALTGRAHAAVSMELTAAGPNGSAIWRQEDTIVTYTGGDDPLVTPLQTAQVAVQLTPGEVLATLEFHAASGVHLSGNGRMQAPVGTDAPIEGRIAGRLPDIAPLLPWFAGNFDLTGVAGSVTLDAAVAGTLGAPRVTGEARLTGGALTLSDLGLTLDAIDVALLGDGSAALKLQGSARAGGPLTLDGELSPIEAGGPTGWVRIRGDRVDAVRLPDRYIQASPDIKLSYARGVLRTEGEVTIPKAQIVVRTLPQSAVSPSRDTVVRDREVADGSGPGDVLGGEIAITLGSDVRLKAFGLDTLLEGTVKLSQGADGEPQGFGVVRLREGKFGAYGKELTIERGTLGFAGPLDDPAVDLRASREVDWEGRRVTAGVLVSGTATRPESRVFSDPAMSEADALSYLVSGRPLQSANSTERSAIAGAALSLGMQQASPLTQALGSAITLDELGVEGGTLDETEVVAGKQLGSDLYMRFTYGLFNRIGTVLARYKLGRNLSIEAASGEDQSLDLIYSVERE